MTRKYSRLWLFRFSRCSRMRGVPLDHHTPPSYEIISVEGFVPYVLQEVSPEVPTAPQEELEYCSSTKPVSSVGSTRG